MMVTISSRALPSSVRSTRMSEVCRAADICDELAEVFRKVAARGVTLDDIPVLVAAVESAQQEIAALVR